MLISLVSMGLHTVETHEIPVPFRTGRAFVRVIWGSRLGSVYQKYRGARQSLDRELDESPSIFSGPLSCPRCAGSFPVYQIDEMNPDRLGGKCSCCGFSSIGEVGEEGRITLIGPVVL